MKAVVYRLKTGLTLANVPFPEADDDFIVVKVATTGFCGSDHSRKEAMP